MWNHFLFYSEEEDTLDYHGIRGNRDGGYHHGGGGRGQTEAADFWEDFNVHDPQSIYADKFWHKKNMVVTEETILKIAVNQLPLLNHHGDKDRYFV